MPIRWYYNRILPDERRDFRLYVFDYETDLLQDTMAVFSFLPPEGMPDSTNEERVSLVLRRFDRSFAEMELVWRWF